MRVRCHWRPSRSESWRDEIASRSAARSARPRARRSVANSAAPDWRALKVAAAWATSTRTRRRTSSAELSAARICANVSAISPARVRPTGAGERQRHGQADAEDPVVDLAPLREHRQGRVGDPLAPHEHQPPFENLALHLGGGDLAPEPERLLHQRAGGQIGGRGHREGVRQDHGALVDVEENGERGAGLLNPTLRLEAEEADPRRLRARDVRLHAGDQRLLGARLGVRRQGLGGLHEIERESVRLAGRDGLVVGGQGGGGHLLLGDRQRAGRSPRSPPRRRRRARRAGRRSPAPARARRSQLRTVDVFRGRSMAHGKRAADRRVARQQDLGRRAPSGRRVELGAGLPHLGARGERAAHDGVGVERARARRLRRGARRSSMCLACPGRKRRAPTRRRRRASP